ncbi:biosynthetic peptidoglycan transglycosylase [Anaeromyxobacter diazotrophicus]|uniref:biosynthetic peptidoglycan transglycosylase n=1 Tax=Anaeromyxobacter diazotrophicus TaxID=2590199 RepID=UPI001590C5D8|nr:biosynthetic peptidoglycan transglycosylase [Anaeromyxobacter diazotrophicus]
MRPNPRPAPTPAPSPSPVPAAPRALRAATAVAAGGALLTLALWAAAQTGAARAELRARVAQALAERAPRARLVGEARLSPRFELVFGPVVVPARAAGAPPVLTVARVAVRPRLAALLGARLEPGAVRLEGVRVDAGVRGGALEELAELAAPARPGGAAPPQAAPPRITFQDLRIRTALARGARALVIETGALSGRAELAREDGRRVARLALRLPGGGDGELDARWGAGPPALALRLRGASPGAIPAALRGRLPFGVEDGALDLALRVPRVEREAALTAELEAEVRGLAVRWARLAPQPVGPLAGRLSATLRWDPRARRLALEGGRAELGTSGLAQVELDAALGLGGEPALELAVRARQVDWAAAVAALPPALRPPAEAPRLEGALGGRLSLAGPLRRPAAWRLDGDVDLRALRPAAAQARPLDRPFAFRAPLPGGGAREVLVGPANPAFVPLATLPAHVWRAVVLSEDAGFFVHHGFDVREVQEALSRSGDRRLRGASTLTQQLAKNLFLTPDRTLVRKVREAIVTLALESSLPKRRLLEIYLNAVEWGPGGVHGLGEAARHWFGKDPRDLSPKEAAFLATVLPNPARFDLYRRRGALTERWEERVRALLVKERAVDALDDDQFYEAWYAPLAFAGR